MEPGESPARALERELEEELGIRGASGDEIASYEYAYPGKDAIALIFFRVTRFEGEPRNLIFQEMRWELRQNLPDFDFVKGDRDFIHAFSK